MEMIFDSIEHHNNHNEKKTDFDSYREFIYKDLTMKYKDENTAALKTQLQRTKRTTQLVTWGVIISTVYVVYKWFMQDEYDLTLSSLTILLVFLVLLLNKKLKNIKAELASRV